MEINLIEVLGIEEYQEILKYIGTLTESESKEMVISYINNEKTHLTVNYKDYLSSSSSSTYSELGEYPYKYSSVSPLLYLKVMKADDTSIDSVVIPSTNGISVQALAKVLPNTVTYPYLFTDYNCYNAIFKYPLMYFSLNESSVVVTTFESKNNKLYSLVTPSTKRKSLTHFSVVNNERSIRTHLNYNENRENISHKLNMKLTYKQFLTLLIESSIVSLKESEKDYSNKQDKLQKNESKFNLDLFKNIKFKENFDNQNYFAPNGLIAYESCEDDSVTLQLEYGSNEKELFELEVQKESKFSPNDFWVHRKYIGKGVYNFRINVKENEIKNVEVVRYKKPLSILAKNRVREVVPSHFVQIFEQFLNESLVGKVAVDTIINSDIRKLLVNQLFNEFVSKNSYDTDMI